VASSAIGPAGGRASQRPLSMEPGEHPEPSRDGPAFYASADSASATLGYVVRYSLTPAMLNMV
jgi:hypothetical protein